MKNRKKYQHLKQSDRDRIQDLLSSGATQASIALILNVDPGTISREISNRKRKNGQYASTTAQQKAEQKRRGAKYQGMKVESNPALRQYLIVGLTLKRSPDELSGRMKKEKQPFFASKNAIYHWLYSAWGQQYCPLLCTKRYNPKRQEKTTAQRTMIPNRVSIDERPDGAVNKTRYGHHEVDTVVAPKKSHNTEAVVLSADRKSKLLLGTRIPSLSPVHMVAAIHQFRQQALVLSMTGDNGIENKYHEQWGVPAFFADPHSPWQKGLIEGSIGLLRRWFFKKGTDWATVSEVQLQEALAILNGKYRKSLGYKSALEVSRARGMIKTRP